MKWIISNRTPAVQRILLVESGPEAVAAAVVPRLRDTFGDAVVIDRLTWGEADPEEHAQVWRSRDYATAAGRLRLLRQLRRVRPSAVAVVCANTPYLRGWRTAVLLAVPAKALIVNENSDFFWLDRANANNLRRMLLSRSGLVGESTVHLIGRALLFPFALGYLAGFAAITHLGRWARQ